MILTIIFILLLQGEISSYDLHPERQLVAKETSKLTYICEVCQKDCKNVQNLGSHRKKSHKLPYRQEWLGENVSPPPLRRKLAIMYIVKSI